MEGAWASHHHPGEGGAGGGPKRRMGAHRSLAQWSRELTRRRNAEALRTPSASACRRWKEFGKKQEGHKIQFHEPPITDGMRRPEGDLGHTGRRNAAEEEEETTACGQYMERRPGAWGGRMARGVGDPRECGAATGGSAEGMRRGVS